MADDGIYHGRLVTDGQGNLLADESRRIGTKTVTLFDDEGHELLDELGQAVTASIPILKFGKNHGRPVAAHEGSYIFLNKGDESHNARHHQRYVNVDGTVDESMTDDPDLVNADDTQNPHHFGVTEDDPHYDEDAPNHTRLQFDPDTIAATVTGHTAAYEGSTTGGDE